MGFQKRIVSLAATVASLALITGCAGGGSQIPASSQSFTQQPLTGSSSSLLSVRSSVNFSASRLAPGPALPHIQGVSHNACTKSITFISDFNNSVIYMLNGSTVCGTITGLSSPQAMDMDSKGNLWVANTGASNLLEFKPPYTGAPIKTLSDTGQYPTSVALCKGYIAAANIVSTAGKNGSVSIWKGSATTPTVLHDKSAVREYFAACDPAGNLYTTWCSAVDSNGFCVTGDGSAEEWKLGKGPAVHLTKVVLQFPGGLDWEGGMLYIGDQTAHTVGEWKAPFTAASKTINLTSASDPVTFSVYGTDKDLVTADAGALDAQIYSLDGTHGDFDKSITISGASLPIGAKTTGDDAI